MSQNSDQLSIDTPELVSIEMGLAGIGSRFIAVLIDTLIWALALVIVTIALIVVMPAIRAFGRLSAQWTVALYTFLIFLFNWGYFTLFEAFWNGQTPGKRVAKIRVIQRSGRAIGLFESMARNFIRYVDQFPFFYAVGVIAVFATKQHQRLGDLAAGTLVVRDRREEAPLWGETGARTFTASIFEPPKPAEPSMAPPLFPASDVSRLAASDLEVMEGFFARRLDLSLETRATLAERIASAVQAKAGLMRPETMSVETFLESVARQLRDQARMH
ncbi:MAG TPA: RDD family protein [Terracidiphilus sp.]